MHWNKVLIAAGVCLLATVQAASAIGIGSGLGAVKRHADPKFISHRGVALAPMGHVIFCSKQPAECVSSGDPIVNVNAAKMRELKQVNLHVNRSIRPVNDTGSSGWADTWTVAPEAGDCEDFALTKRAELLSRGWPSKALRLAVTKTPYGEGHAVLVVRTTDGDMVLDNRNNKVIPWYRSDLTWLKIQSEDNAKRWLSI